MFKALILYKQKYSVRVDFLPHANRILSPWDMHNAVQVHEELCGKAPTEAQTVQLFARFSCKLS